MTPRSPRSTLFPYTTLFRSHPVELLEVARLPRREERDQREAREDEEGVHHPVGHHPARLLRLGGVVGERDRSEEHTSELQSHSELVCRLLLEKKKLAPHATR